MADMLLEDFARSITHLQHHAPSAPITAADGIGFTHSAIARLPVEIAR
jgi:hypothetical protein